MEPPGRVIREPDLLVVTLAALVLIIGELLPWYRLWGEGCGMYRSASVSQVASGGLRLDLVACCLATWMSALFDRRFRFLTIVGAWMTLILAFYWWFNSPVGGIEIQGECRKRFQAPWNFHYGVESGVGVFVSIGAALALIYGAHLRSRRLRMRDIEDKCIE